MTKVEIPETLEEAVQALAGIGRLLTAKEWERAAIVAAYVEPDLGHGGRQETFSSERLVSARQFACHKIAGLSSQVSVLRYVKAWLQVAPRPEPGETVELPRAAWPPKEDTYQEPESCSDEPVPPMLVESLDEPEVIEEVIEEVAYCPTCGQRIP